MAQSTRGRANPVADLASRKRERRVRWPGGDWEVRAVHGPILGTEERYAWKRELSCFQGQHLPDALWGHSSLELRHAPSGVCLSFCALEALRAWSALDVPPVKVARAWDTTEPPSHDWTFTTDYPGSTRVAQLGDAGRCRSRGRR